MINARAGRNATAPEDFALKFERPRELTPEEQADALKRMFGVK